MIRTRRLEILPTGCSRDFFSGWASLHQRLPCTNGNVWQWLAMSSHGSLSLLQTGLGQRFVLFCLSSCAGTLLKCGFVPSSRRAARRRAGIYLLAISRWLAPRDHVVRRRLFNDRRTPRRLSESES